MAGMAKENENALSHAGTRKGTPHPGMLYVFLWYICHRNAFKIKISILIGFSLSNTITILQISNSWVILCTEENRTIWRRREGTGFRRLVTFVSSALVWSNIRQNVTFPLLLREHVVFLILLMKNYIVFTSMADTAKCLINILLPSSLTDPVFRVACAQLKLFSSQDSSFSLNRFLIISCNEM